MLGAAAVTDQAAETPAGYAAVEEAPQLALDVGGQPAVELDSARWDYANMGTALLGRAVEAETGEEFADWTRREIMQRLGMANSSWRVRRASVSDDDLRAIGRASVDDPESVSPQHDQVTATAL